MIKAKSVSTKKVKEAPKPPASWELVIADAETEIARLRRSIELCKYNQRVVSRPSNTELEHHLLSEFLEDFPSVSRVDAIAALEEARISLTATLK